MRTHCQLDPYEQSSMKFELKYSIKHFIQQNTFDVMIWKLLWNKYLFIHFNLLFAKWQTFSPGLLWTVQNVAFISNFVPNEKKFWEPRTRDATKHIEAKIRWRIFFRRHFCTHFLEWKYLNFDLKFHWSLFLSIQFTISKHRFRQWLGADQATSHYLNQWWFISQTYTVETLYNTINFCWSTHKRHSIARPKGRGVGCLLWVQRATYCVDLSILSSIKYLL